MTPLPILPHRKQENLTCPFVWNEKTIVPVLGPKFLQTLLDLDQLGKGLALQTLQARHVLTGTAANTFKED